MPKRFPCFDTHIHLNAWKDSRREKLLEEARAAGVGPFLVPGVNRASWPDLVSLAEREGIWAAPGLHPLAANEWNEDAEGSLARLLEKPNLIAVGEIGLDGLIDMPMEIQEQTFRSQLRLAVSAGKPVLIHCRKATGRLMEILKEEQASRVGGLFHAFSGSVETAHQAIDLGFGIAFGGPLTYPNAKKAPLAAGEIPPEWIVLETDAPDLAPHPHRGEENRPAWLPLIAERLAQIRQWSLEETCVRTADNARRILRLSDS